MSLAIDREEINDLIFLGLATPRQATISSNATYYQARWGEENPWIAYDPDEANRMLDAIGLAERNRDDVRLLNGEPLLLTLVFFSGPANVGLDLTAELVKEYWEDVGIGIQLNQMERAAIDEAQDAGLVDVYGEVTHGAEVYDFLSTIGGTVNAGREGATRYWNYWTAVRNGADPSEAPGEKPPELLQMLYDTALTESQSTVFGSDEYHEVRTRVYEMHYDNLFTIGTVGLAPQPIIYRANLGNIALAVCRPGRKDRLPSITTRTCGTSSSRRYLIEVTSEAPRTAGRFHFSWHYSLSAASSTWSCCSPCCRSSHS